MQTTPPSAFLRVKKGPFFSSCIPTFGVAAAGPPLTRCCLTVSLITVPLDAPCATSPVRRSRWRPRCVDDGLGPGPAPRQPSQRNRNHGHAPVTVRRGLMLCHGHPLAVDVPALLLKYVQFLPAESDEGLKKKNLGCVQNSIAFHQNLGLLSLSSFVNLDLDRRTLIHEVSPQRNEFTVARADPRPPAP